MPVSMNVFVGLDIPDKVEKLTVTVIDGQNYLSWTAPTTGANMGFLKADALTYKIYRVVDEARTLIAENVATTSYVDVAASGTVASYVVIPVNTAGEGKEELSGEVVHFGAEYKDINVAPNANVANSNIALPFDTRNSSTATEMIIYPADLYQAVGKMQGLVFKNSFSVATSMTKTINVYMGETDDEDLSQGWIPASMPVSYTHLTLPTT